MSPLRSDGQREEPLSTPEEQLFWVGCLMRAVPLVEGSVKPKGGKSRKYTPTSHFSFRQIPCQYSFWPNSMGNSFGQTQWETGQRRLWMEFIQLSLPGHRAGWGEPETEPRGAGRRKQKTLAFLQIYPDSGGILHTTSVASPWREPSSPLGCISTIDS